MRTKASRKSGASRRARPALGSRIYHHWLLGIRHLVAGLGALAHRPVASLMTIGVIGIALALPAGFYVLLVNLDEVSHGWHDAGRATLFLKREVGLERARELAETLRRRPDLAQVTVVSPQQAMREFRRLSGFGDALDALPGNPLPAVLILDPERTPKNVAAAEALVVELESLDDVAMAQFDVAWQLRFQAMLRIAQRGVWVVGALLLLAVLLVVGNTIRMEIESRRDEIEVYKLVGATDRFIRRPFLYGGIWYGALGGLLAVLVVGIALWLLSEPVAELARNYQSAFRLEGPGLFGAAMLVGGGALIGLAGAGLAVSRHLKDIEPV